MTAHILYRENASAPIPTSSYAKGSPLSSVEIDGNFRSIQEALDNVGGDVLIETTSDTAEHYISFVSTTSGIASSLNVDTDLTFNPDTNTLTASTIAANMYTTTSDERKKTNIQKIENPIKDICLINGVSFDWKETNEPSMGVIAQNVETVYPSLVITDADGNKSVNYNGLVGALVETVKHLNEKIEHLEEKLSVIQVNK